MAPRSAPAARLPPSPPTADTPHADRPRPARHLPTLFLALLCLPTPARAQSVEWTQFTVGGPAPRDYHAMAYDAARGVTVLFGGFVGTLNGGTSNGETWEWNGTAWTQRLVSGPSPRLLHAMAYDAARGVTVLLGGVTNTTSGSIYNGETWEWNGSAWTQRAVTGPSARSAHAMAYDSARGVTVLFGGFNNGTVNGETWEWNGTGWTQRSVSGPSARSGHAMAYDGARGVTVLFGGFTGSASSANGETWEWNGAAWMQRTITGPSPRYLLAMAYDAVRGVTVLFGGQNSDYSSSGDTWEWDGIAWARRTVSGPSPRFYHAMAYDSARGETVLFGGYTDTYPNVSDETWGLRTYCYPNCDASTTPPFLNVNDFICFLNRFASGSPYANCDHSSTPPVLNVNDFSCFLNQFAAACP